MTGRKTTIRLILGGISSGKSEFAEKMIYDMRELSRADFYYFTPAGVPEDEEMKAKVAAHLGRRPGWLKTVECGIEPAAALADLKSGDSVLFDSAGTLLSRLMMSSNTDAESNYAVDEAFEQFTLMLNHAETRGLNIVFVSEEVGMELVALSASGRSFQKAMGLLNQLIAAAADEVYFVTAGIAQRLK